MLATNSLGKAKYNLTAFLWKIVWFWFGASPTLPLLFPRNLYWVSAFSVAITLGIGLLFLSASMLTENKVAKSRLLMWTMLYFFWIIFTSLLSNYTWRNPLRVFGFLFASLAWIIIVFLGATRLPFHKSVVFAARYYVFGVMFTTTFLFLLGRQASQRFGNNELLHPNLLGFMYSIAFLSTSFLSLFRKVYQLIFQLLFGMFLLLTFSKTSIIATFAGYMVGIGFQRCRWRQITSLIAIGILAGLASTWLADYLKAQWQHWLSNPYLVATLTGRTILWSWVVEMVRGHPWTGYGFGSFRDIFAPYSQYYGFIVPATQAHNAFLDALFTGGYIGAFIFFIIVIKSVVLILQLSFKLKNTPNVCFAVAVMTFLFTRALVEGALNLGRDFTVLIYIALCAENQLQILKSGFQYESLAPTQPLHPARR